MVDGLKIFYEKCLTEKKKQTLVFMRNMLIFIKRHHLYDLI